MSDALPILRAALDARLAVEKDDAVAKQLRAHGDYVYDLQAVDRLAILRQTLEVVQKMLDVERRITDVASAKQLSPEVVRLMSEQARLVEQQPHVKITATEEEAAKCEAITTRINALIETHDGEVRHITAMPEGGNIFRREIDTEVTRDPSGFLAAQLRAVKGPSSTSAGTRADASPPNPESEARGEKFVSLVERLDRAQRRSHSRVASHQGRLIGKKACRYLGQADRRLHGPGRGTE